MYVSPWLQAALLPELYKVCGVKCRPLSVWHVFALASTGNAYIADDPTRMDREAARELLLYCGNNHKEGSRLYSSEEYRNQEKKAVSRLVDKMEWLDVHSACMRYVTDCRRAPTHKEPVSDGKTASAGRKAGAPLGWILVDFLSSGNPDKIEAAWDTPHAVACCLFDAHRNINGQDDTLASVEEEIRWDSYAKPEAS
jgi:hypothetical protein